MRRCIFLIVFLFVNSSFADVKFEKKKIRLAQKILSVEIADTPKKLARGLMYRKNLPKDHGMLFVFPDEKRRSFWMKNTFIPLSIGFFDSKRRLLEVAELSPPSTVLLKKVATYYSKKSARYVLEMNKGWFKKNNVSQGQTFVFIKTNN